MKNLFTCLAVFAALSVSAQSYQLPYNPDHDIDGYIGVDDILQLLATFGQEFDAAILSSDSSSAIVLTGNLSYYSCLKSCKSLGREWDMIDSYGLAIHKDTLFNYNSGQADLYCWTKLEGGHFDNGQEFTTRLQGTGVEQRLPWFTYAGSLHQCYCEAKVRPEIEYQVVFGTSVEAINTNVQLALQEGWIPLGSASCSGTADCYQTMWRYAE